MPIYEYRCKSCGAKTSLLVLSLSRQAEVECQACGSQDLTRLFSAFAYHRSEGDRLSEVDTGRASGDEYYKDSRNVGLWAKKRVRELGADAETQRQVDQVVDKARDETSKLFE
ncbi:MAG: zinc ribbon domain-containing protein [Dehalococcoidia bacterium]|nr:zinc ribbon domain-containing protein [Dehalococcoidia bacterium]